MDLRSLNYFVHAAKDLNFTQAAKECYISQTAMSLTIAKIEDELGFPLFDRNNHVIGLRRPDAIFTTGRRRFFAAMRIRQSAVRTSLPVIPAKSTSRSQTAMMDSILCRS